jgi:WD40 repeat protein
MRTHPFIGCVLVLVVALASGSTASAQKGKDKDKDKDKNPSTLAEAKGVTRLEYSPDGKFIVADYRTGTFRYPDNVPAQLGIWDAKTGEFKVKLDKPPRNCECIAISPDNKKVAAISVGEKQLKTWDAASGKPLDQYTLPEWKGSIQNCQFMAFASDGTLYGVRDKQLFEVPSGGKFKLIGGKMDLASPEEMTFDSAGKRFVLINNLQGRPAGEIRVYDVAKGGDPQKAPTTGHVRAVALSRDGKTLAMSYLPARGKGSRLEFWDAADWKLRAAAQPDTRKDLLHYNTLTFSPDGKKLAGVPLFEKTGAGKCVDVLDADGKLLREIKTDTRAVSLTFSPDGKTLAAILYTNTIVFFDPETGEEKKP